MANGNAVNVFHQGSSDSARDPPSVWRQFRLGLAETAYAMGLRRLQGYLQV